MSEKAGLLEIIELSDTDVSDKEHEDGDEAEPAHQSKQHSSKKRQDGHRHSDVASEKEIGFVASEHFTVPEYDDFDERKGRDKRETILYEIMNNQKHIDEICICCGSWEVVTKHPMIRGGLCRLCRDNFLNTYFVYDIEDGYQAYCAICCSGRKLLLCGNFGCYKGFCDQCLDVLVSPGTTAKVEAADPWICYFCQPLRRTYSLLQPRKKFSLKLKQFYNRECSDIKMFAPVSIGDQKPIRVLSLFRDVTIGLTDIGLLGSMAGHGSLKFMWTSRDILRNYKAEFGCYDFVFGAVPLRRHFYKSSDYWNAHRYSSCIRKHPPAWYFYNFCRILKELKPDEDDDAQPFFWLFMDVFLLSSRTRSLASRFLKGSQVTFLDKRSPNSRSVVLWSNLPCLQSNIDSISGASKAAHDQVQMYSIRDYIRKIRKIFMPLREYFKVSSSTTL